MEKQSSCKCCGFSRLAFLLLIIIALAAIAYYQLSKEDQEKAINNATSEQLPATNSLLATPTQSAKPEQETVTLDPKAVQGASVIEYQVVSKGQIQATEQEEAVNQETQPDSGGELDIVLAASATWQGDFTKERVAATLLAALKQSVPPKGTTIINITLLPAMPSAKINQQKMYSDIALGTLALNTQDASKNQMSVAKRGYLPQELDFIALYAKKYDQFKQGDSLDGAALTDAVIEALGPGSLGMEFPFLNLLQVQNASELFAKEQPSTPGNSPAPAN